MIRTLWFFIKAALFIGASIWLISQPGDLELNFLGYDVKVKTGVFLLALTVFILFSFYLLRMVRAVLMTPKTVAKHKRDYQQKVGYLSLTRGLVAVASGDVEQANYHAKKATKLLQDDTGLPLLLEAQAARLRGDDGAAKACFQGLLENKDTAFLGARGLMKSAIDNGNKVQALEHAKAALKVNPNQPSVLKMVYDLEIQNQHWDNALNIGKKAQKLKAITIDKFTSDRIAIHLLSHDEKMLQGQQSNALRDLKTAYKLDPAYVPTVTRLAQSYMDDKKRRKAVNLIENAWKVNPHPELADMWDKLTPYQGKNNNTKRLAWVNKLVEMDESNADSHIMAAKAAMDMEYWGEAKAYLMVAEKLYPTAQVFHLRALVEKRITHGEDHVEDLLNKATQAMPKKSWVCVKTGMTYSEWSAIAMPHESFNTIVWDIPSVRLVNDNDASALSRSDTTALLIDPAA